MENHLSFLFIIWLGFCCCADIEAMKDVQKKQTSSGSWSPCNLSPDGGRIFDFTNKKNGQEPKSLSSSSPRNSVGDGTQNDFEMTSFDEDELKDNDDLTQKGNDFGLSRPASFFTPHDAFVPNNILDESPLTLSPFPRDVTEKSKCKSLWSGCLQLVGGLFSVLCKTNCCLPCHFLKRKPEEWRFEWARLTDKNLTQVKDEQLLEGKGGFIFWDCRNSSDYCKGKTQENGHGWQDFALFMQEMTKHLFLPIGEKYKMDLVGMGGDGPLFVRPQGKDEKQEDVVHDIVHASLELIGRYPRIKQTYKLDGPQYCGVGCSMGKYYQSFVPQKRDSIQTIPAFVSENINDAFFCEQANKQFGSALVLNDQLYDYIHSNAIKGLLTLRQIDTKLGLMNVWTASQTCVAHFYEQALLAENQLDIIKISHKIKRHGTSPIIPIIEIKKAEPIVSQKKSDESIEIIHYN